VSRDGCRQCRVGDHLFHRRFDEGFEVVVVGPRSRPYLWFSHAADGTALCGFVTSKAALRDIANALVPKPKKRKASPTPGPRGVGP